MLLNFIPYSHQMLLCPCMVLKNSIWLRACNWHSILVLIKENAFLKIWKRVSKCHLQMKIWVLQNDFLKSCEFNFFGLFVRLLLTACKWCDPSTIINDMLIYSIESVLDNLLSNFLKFLMKNWNQIHNDLCN